jgi:hypothetical protein
MSSNRIPEPKRGRRNNVKRQIYWMKRVCRQKKAHDTLLGALSHARFVHQEDPSRPVNWYECEACGMLHVGHVPKNHEEYGRFAALQSQELELRSESSRATFIRIVAKQLERCLAAIL